MATHEGPSIEIHTYSVYSIMAPRTIGIITFEIEHPESDRQIHVPCAKWSWFYILATSKVKLRLAPTCNSMQLCSMHYAVGQHYKVVFIVLPHWLTRQPGNGCLVMVSHRVTLSGRLSSVHPDNINCKVRKQQVCTPPIGRGQSQPMPSRLCWYM